MIPFIYRIFFGHWWYWWINLPTSRSLGRKIPFTMVKSANRSCYKEVFHCIIPKEIHEPKGAMWNESQTRVVASSRCQNATQGFLLTKITNMVNQPNHSSWHHLPTRSVSQILPVTSYRGSWWVPCFAVHQAIECHHLAAIAGLHIANHPWIAYQLSIVFSNLAKQ